MIVDFKCGVHRNVTQVDIGGISSLYVRVDELTRVLESETSYQSESVNVVREQERIKEDVLLLTATNLNGASVHGLTETQRRKDQA